MTVHVLNRWAEPIGRGFDVTSNRPFRNDVTPLRAMSPFTLGPVQLWGGHWAQNVENAWQYSKCYHADYNEWLAWAKRGWAKDRADRYPMGKGAKPYFSVWGTDTLDYVTARKWIYIPLYVQAVRFYKYETYDWLAQIHNATGNITLLDFDAYDHRKLGYSWDDVINDPERKMGHAFVLGMMLEGRF